MATARLSRPSRALPRRRWRVARAVLAGLAATALVALAAAGEWLSRPAARRIGPPPADLGAQAVRLEANGAALHGWFVPGRPGGGAVLLLHGVRADRTQMLGRARFLQRAGHASLLLDLQAHGESPGERITFGAREAAGVHAALQHLRRTLPGERMAVIGVSLGAAATVLAQPRPAPDAVVLESMYPTLEDAVADRLALHLGRWGAALAPTLLWQVPLRLGVGLHELRPLDRIGALGAPVLVASGSEDRHTPWPETQRLFEAAAAPKALWRVEGAAHVDLHDFDPAAYEARILRFLRAHLQAPQRRIA